MDERRPVSLSGYDHWKTTEPDDGWRKQKCEWCNGTGTVQTVTHWRDRVEGGEAECDECGGEGTIVIGPDGYPAPGKRP